MANNEITFEDYVKKILGEDIFNKGACPDQYVGKLKELKDGFKREISKKHIEDSYKIIVILESSHKDEYEDDRNKLAPAKGKTGKNIRKYLADIISKLDSDKSKNYSIFLINPIQYQCLKGETNRSKTKKVFQRIMA